MDLQTGSLMKDKAGPVDNVRKHHLASRHQAGVLNVSSLDDQENLRE
jgi:hypothetical protein